MNDAIITYKSQITIPRDVREALDLQAGDRVLFVVEGDKALMVPIRARGLERLRGICRGRVLFPGREVEREAARQAVAQHTLEFKESHADSQDGAGLARLRGQVFIPH